MLHVRIKVIINSSEVCMKVCRFCKELIKEEANVCKYCGRDQRHWFLIIAGIYLALMLFLGMIFGG